MNPEPQPPAPANHQPAGISARGVTKIFHPGKAQQVTAIENIDLDIEAGSFVSLIGPSGCGKSTLLRLIAGLIEPTSGELRVNDKPASAARKSRDYGMVFQKASLFDWRTVRKNIELPLELLGWDRAARRARVAEMLELVQLGDFAKSYPAELSGGMQQRVSIARALAFEPSFLLMDEPFGALDEMTREHMQNELVNLWETTHTTIVFITHSVPEAVYLSNKVCVMTPRPGRFTAEIDINLGRRTTETRNSDAFFADLVHVREQLHAVMD